MVVFKTIVVALFLLSVTTLGYSEGLEAIMVEKYHVYSPMPDSNYSLVMGTVTYRVYADLQPGYRVQAVYGNAQNELKIWTSSFFFNSQFGGHEAGANLNSQNLNTGLVALDSWITIGNASSSHIGVPMAIDTNGSVLTCPGLEVVDGLLDAKTIELLQFNINLKPFMSTVAANEFVTRNGGWAVGGGVAGGTKENLVLLGQFTTDGEFAFWLNLQLGTSNGKAVKYVWGLPEADEIMFEGLHFSTKD